MFADVYLDGIWIKAIGGVALGVLLLGGYIAKEFLKPK